MFPFFASGFPGPPLLTGDQASTTSDRGFPYRKKTKLSYSSVPALFSNVVDVGNFAYEGMWGGGQELQCMLVAWYVNFASFMCIGISCDVAVTTMPLFCAA